MSWRVVCLQLLKKLEHLCDGVWGDGSDGDGDFVARRCGLEGKEEEEEEMIHRWATGVFEPFALLRRR